MQKDAGNNDEISLLGRGYKCDKTTIKRQ